MLYLYLHRVCWRNMVRMNDKFVYKGRVELFDLEVVVGSAIEDERRFEGSFVVYSGKKYLGATTGK